MQMVLPPADRKLDLDLASSQSHFPLEGLIDLSSIPEMVGPVSMEDDEDNNSYIQDIPGVRSLGIKRDCRNLTHTAPSKLQRIMPIATNNDLLQVTKTLQFSTAENSVAPFVKAKMETCMSIEETKREALVALSNLSNRGSIGKKDKLKDIAWVTERDTLVQFYKSLKEEVAGHVEENKALKEKTSVKDGQITKLRKDLTDINTEKEISIKRHSKEIEDLRTSFRIERAELEGGNKVLRDLLTERNGLITQQSREIEVLKTCFSTVKSKVFKAFMEEETQNRLMLRPVASPPNNDSEPS